MAQPNVNPTRQSGPQAKKAPEDMLHKLPPGGPIKPAAQGFVNPGPTDNLRGVEPNTAHHKGTPNPEQVGTHRRIGDHNPGMDQAGNSHGHGIDVKPGNKGVAKHHAAPVMAPPPNPQGVRK